MPKVLAVTALVGVVGWSGSLAGQSGGGAASGPGRPLLDQYCVSCHNERLKTAGLVLEKVDVTDVREWTA